MPKLRYLFIALIVALSLSNTYKTVKDIKERTKKLEDVKGDVLALEKENKELQQELEFRKTKEYIEQEARNKLNLSKPGEIMVVIPENDADRPQQAINKSQEESSSKPKEQIYKQWLRIFW